MTKKIKVILTCFKQTSYEDYTHFFKSVEIEVPYNKGEEGARLWRRISRA